MAKTRGAHSFRQQVPQSPTPPAVGPSTACFFATASSSTTASPSTVTIGAGSSVPAARPTVAPAAGDAEGSSFVALAQRRYHTRVGPTPPAPSHPRLARRAPQAKMVGTSGPGESSTLRSRAPPSPPYQGIAGALN